jgi:cardiolipin synthase (CMP-forming)
MKSRIPLFILPNALTTGRLLAGPVFLVWGSLPARGIVLALLIAAAATDLLDGRIARTLEVASNFGGGLDTTADKVFVLSLVLKLAENDALPWWVFVVLLSQYSVLAVAGSVYSCRFHRIPVPDASAHAAAVLAVAFVIAGVTMPGNSWTVIIAACLIIANLRHIAIAWRRAAGIQQ